VTTWHLKKETIMKTVFLISAAALAVSATPVFAQESTNDNMTGAYFGVITGYDSVTIDDGTVAESQDDLMYGLVTGYDYDMGSVVLGVEAEYADSSVEQRVDDVLTTGDSFALKASTDLYAGIRAGFKASDKALVYLKGGFTTGRAKLEYDDGVDTTSESDNLNGYRVGVGAEVDLVANVTIRAEYRYSDYGDYSYQGVASGLSATRHQGVVGLVSKF
jgi:outer membrane immunogenic protein